MPLADNDVTRMTRHQLAQRIEQMQATAKRNSTIGATNGRHRPMEDRRRWAKIADYEAELARRIRSDETQAQADARADAIAHPAGAPIITTPTCAECAETGRTAYACADLQTERPLCARHGAAAAARRHSNQQQPAAPVATAGAQEEQTMTYNQAQEISAREDNRQQAYESNDHPHAQAEQRRYQRDNAYDDNDGPAYSAESQRRARISNCEDLSDDTRERLLARPRESAADAYAAERQATDAKLPRVTLQGPTPVIAPPPDARLSIACPQCGAAIGARCTNYSGAHCAPHGARKLERTPAARQGKHDAAQASEHRRQVIAAARRQQTQAETARPEPTPEISAIGAGPTRTITAAEAVAEIQTAAARPEPADLDAAVEALVARYTCGSVIDAAWAASARLFQPGRTRGRA